MPYKDPAKERERQRLKYARTKDKVLARQKAYKMANREHVREIQRRASKKYYMSEKGKKAQRQGSRSAWAKKDGKYAARQSVSRAVSAGRITKPDTCSKNTNECYGRIEAHHNDYSKPLEIVWLCLYHHHKLHGRLAGQ
jgi:hypothetical protein